MDKSYLITQCSVFKKLDGDASSRIFYRLKRKKTTSIIVYSNKEKKSNLSISPF